MSTTCRICTSWPAAGHHVIDLRSTIVALRDDQFFPGWTVLALKRHAVELFDLTPDERASVIEEVTAVARALADIFTPHKMNYALYGNQDPHMHWHVVPRLTSDPAPLETPWNVPHTPVRLAGAELAERVRALRARLAP